MAGKSSHLTHSSSPDIPLQEEEEEVVVEVVEEVEEVEEEEEEVDGRPLLLLQEGCWRRLLLGVAGSSWPSSASRPVVCLSPTRARCATPALHPVSDLGLPCGPAKCLRHRVQVTFLNSHRILNRS